MTNAYFTGGGEGRRRRSAEEADANRGETGKGECYLDSFSLQGAFRDFQSRVPLKKLVSTQRAHHIWQWYELCGTETDFEGSSLIYSSPVVFLHGVNGTAAIYFQQLEGLAEKGYRVLSVQWPALSSLASFLSSFDEFLTHVLSSAPARAARPARPAHRSASSPVASAAALARGDSEDRGETRTQRRGVHLFGAGLGGVLCLYFAQRRPEMVASVALCNAFLNSAFLLGALAPLQGVLAPMYHLLPHAALRKIIVDTYLTPKATPEAVFVPPQDECTPGSRRTREREDSPESVWATASDGDGKSAGVWVVPQEDLQIRNSKEFLVSHIDALSAKDLAARLALQMAIGAAPPLQKAPEKMLILQSLDADVPPDVADDLRNFFPHAKVAELRDGGQFPFLSRPEEVTLYMQVHLRSCGLFPDLHLIKRQVSDEETTCSLQNAFSASRLSNVSSLSEQPHIYHPSSPSTCLDTVSRSAYPQSSLYTSYNRSSSSSYNTSSSCDRSSSYNSSFDPSSSAALAGGRRVSGGFEARGTSAQSQRTQGNSSDGTACGRGSSDIGSRDVSHASSCGKGRADASKVEGRFADEDLIAQERWNRKNWKNPFKEFQ
ncbi:conserved hypothetical protein [Neospora caninum Liverpool]|uniref:Maspardin n=1 Tax=Neospora caninum (strain Liverpool) TaxID=572307 RepID=F0VN97_NEOCL|nr:conserved hypothetical protein [Neospora caninum Liverpool]CBZ55193.1 conserved hypothetical protein [Neospora caninum Liverpool]CEL69920.1 TPA: hypothetical protein BN1204_056170 [Neospora caninum Liverpool]|eukprot:XP_003885221.1 conserved hypothetical protein [Neospora caninum Liverpool]